ncbi:MAG: serine/threonine-protein kinase [Actinomycetota bacterium]
MPPGPGQIDAYRLETRVARGRSGEVFRATTAGGSAVAIKVHERAADGRLEAERLSAVAHPGVAPLLDRGVTENGRVWLALPWIEGATLGHHLSVGQPLTLDRTRLLVNDLAAAIDALHAAGLVHGDLSPDNVLIDGNGRPVLIDLAAAMPVDAAAIDRTTGVEVATTPRYAAPEVAGGRPVGPAADVYALALIAYEAITGAFPFPDVATPIAMLGHHASSEPVAPSEHRPNLPPAVDVVLLRALAKNPSDRPSSAGEFAADLAEGRVPAGWRDPVSADRPGPGPRRRRRWLLAATAVLTVTAIIAGVGLIGGTPGEDDPSEEPDAFVSVPGSASAWPSGRAAGLSCNLIEVSDFEAAALPDHFYRGDPTNTAVRSSGDGVDDSAALQVGADNTFGLYGEIVPIGTQREFVFTAWIRHGLTTRTAIYVDYLDEDFVQLTAERDRLKPDGRPAEPAAAREGTRVTVQSIAPDAAVYAVPTFFKDGSPGTLLVDEVVFGAITTCPDLTG